MTQTSTDELIKRCYAALLLTSAAREVPPPPPADTRGQHMSDAALRGLISRFGITYRCGAPRELLLKIVRSEGLIERAWA